MRQMNGSFYSYHVSRRMVQSVYKLATLLACLAFGLAPLCLAQFQLVKPGTGWLLSGSHLYWTENRGADWRDITPSIQGREVGNETGNVYFLDGSDGWATSTAPSAPEGSLQAAPFSLLHTADGGVTWLSVPVQYPSMPPWIEDTITGPSSIFFADDAHGWLSIGLSGLTKPGLILATSDGGKTWHWLAQPPHSGRVYFKSLQDGWLISDDGDELFATHDGAQTWSKLELSTSDSGHRPIFSEMPRFEDGKNSGDLAVTLAGSPGAPSEVVFFSSDPLGKVWKKRAVLITGQVLAVALADSRIVVPTRSGTNGRLTTRAYSIEQNNKVQATVLGGARPVKLFFADASNGWALMSDGHLLDSADAGSSWKDITPKKVLPPVEAAPIIAKAYNVYTAAGLTSQTSVTPLASTSSTAHISKRMGFDSKYVPTNDSVNGQVMAAWWKSSPYYDTSLYLPASPNRQGSKDPNLVGTSGSNWVSSVEAEGWGLIPVWVGLQAPCVLQTGLALFDTTSPAAEGTSEADKAVANAATFNLTKSVIYLDIENYDTTNAACSAAVKSFVGAWVLEMHVKGFSAGVYANVTPLQQDISKSTTIPDEVWIANYVNAPGIGKASIWGGTVLSDSLWPTNQRLRQFLGGATETYGGFQVTPLDRDLDASYVAGSQAAKAYSSWTLTRVDHPATSPETAFYGVNNIYMGQSPFIPPQTTGIYCDNCSFGTVNVGFLWDNGTFISINDTLDMTAGAGAEAKPYGANDFGSVVGHYAIPGGNQNGFLYKSATSTTSASTSLITLPASWNAVSTLPGGINGVGDISGAYLDSAGGQHGFIVDYKGTSTSFDHSGAKYVEIVGLNGLRQASGYYTDAKSVSHGFVYSKTDGSITDISCPSNVPAVITGINNNGIVSGYCGASMFIYDTAMSMFSYLLTPGNGNDQAWGVNDANIAVGFCTLNPCGDILDGFYAVPQP